jgi:hypothetical protein
MAAFVTNLDLFMFLRSEGDLKNWAPLYEAIIIHIPMEMCSEDVEAVKSFLKTTVNNLNRRWVCASRNQKTFINRHAEWLELKIKWPKCSSVDLSEIFCAGSENIEENSPVDVDMEAVGTVCSTSVGTSTESQHRKPFIDLSNKQRKRRSTSLMDYSTEELSYALVARLKIDEKNDLARIIDHIMKNSDSVAVVKNALFEKKKKKTIDQDHTLALCTSLNLSKWKYSCLRKILIDYDVSVFPCYQLLLEAKKRCYPEHIEITERGAKVPLQALLDLTVKRILQVVGAPVDSSTDGLKLISKWGFDGASSQSTYKQKSEDTDFNDSSVFMSSLVPLKLVSNHSTIWENPKPSSTTFCRPIKFEFCKETAEYVKQEEAALKEEIDNITSTKWAGLEISHDLHMTMIDGKVATIITDTPSASTCNICFAKPTEMNKLPEVFAKPVREDVYKYGISSLHMWIRCMECILHIAYNLDFKAWSARGQTKELKAAKKQSIQDQFKDEMGLLIDCVKQGFGSTNDGNTARKFFRHYEKSSKITNIDKNLIKQFAVILQTINTGSAINIEKFRTYCRETAELFVHLYPWFYMPASVHKLLLHGADICQHFGLIPIGILSEEASEARNKDFRRVRECHTRKFCRKKTNEDIFHNFLISSDPYLSYIRPKYESSKQLDIFPEVVDLLQFPAELSEEIEMVDLQELQPEKDPLL